MICQNCQHESSNIRFIKGVGERCHNCGEFSEAGGTKVTGSLTRNSFRIRTEQAQFQADMLPAHVYDKTSKKLVANPDFVEKYPDRVKDYLTNDEMKAQHMPKLAEHSDSLRETVTKHKAKLRASVEHAGDASTGVERAIK